MCIWFYITYLHNHDQRFGIISVAVLGNVGHCSKFWETMENAVVVFLIPRESQGKHTKNHGGQSMISSENDLHMVNFHYVKENDLGTEWRGLTSKHGDTWDYNICGC